MQTNDGFESERQEKEATKLHEDNGACNKTVSGNGGDTSGNGSHFKDIDLNDDDVEVKINDKSIVEEKQHEADSKKSR
jgi:hypothetical protein